MVELERENRTMNQATKDAYADKMNAQLAEWGARFAFVKAKVAQGSADVRIDYHKQLEDWQTKETTFKTRMEELRAAGAESYEAVKASAQAAWSDLSTIVEKFGDKK